MISLVANLLQLLAQTFQNLLYVTTLVGQVIVNILFIIGSTVYNIVETLILFLRIIYEDNVVLREDIPTTVDEVFNNVIHQCAHAQKTLETLVGVLVHQCTQLFSMFKWIIDTLITMVCEVSLMSKNTIILLGDSIWMILTFIPLQLPILLKPVLRNVADTCIGVVVNAYMALLDITNFLTDVPLQSFTGIITAIVITRLTIHFQEEIRTYATVMYWTLLRKFLYLYHCSYNYITNSEVQVITHLVGTPDVGTSEIALDQGNDEAADALCIICQERQKCVLTLPCRHVCLCTECCMRLYGYQRTCPICRTFIYHSVTVYL